MQSCNVAIVPTLLAPPKEAKLVIFADKKNYVTQGNSAVMLASASRYAIKHNVYLIPERFIAANFLCLCLLSPKGEVLGVQRACHLNLTLREHNFYCDNAISVFNTPIGNISLLVDVDVNMPQVARSAVEKGAELLVSSQFVQLYDFFEDRVNYNVVNTATSNGVLVVAAVNNGGVIINGKGETVVPFTEDLPIQADIDILPQANDVNMMAKAQQLLYRHKNSIITREGS